MLKVFLCAHFSEFYQHIGCYNDTDVRALSINLSWNVASVEECYQLAKERGFLYFGTQFGKECWSSADAANRYNVYGTKANCEGGMGGYWSNDVYVIGK